MNTKCLEEINQRGITCSLKQEGTEGNAQLVWNFVVRMQQNQVSCHRAHECIYKHSGKQYWS